MPSLIIASFCIISNLKTNMPVLEVHNRWLVFWCSCWCYSFVFGVIFRFFAYLVLCWCSRVSLWHLFFFTQAHTVYRLWYVVLIFDWVGDGWGCMTKAYGTGRLTGAIKLRHCHSNSCVNHTISMTGLCRWWWDVSFGLKRQSHSTSRRTSLAMV